MIPDIGDVNTGNINVIPSANVGVGVVYTRPLNFRELRQVNLRDIPDKNIADNRIWVRNSSVAIPREPPVVVNVGKPIVNMPGCVEVHKENAGERNKNKQLVDNDPKGNVVLCDAGAPSFNPLDYESNKLRWETIYKDAPQAGGVDTGDPPPPPETPSSPPPPKTPGETAEDVPCPPPNARRIGDLNQAGTERVKEYELQVDPANPEKQICVTLWEDIPFVDKYLPSASVVTTTAGIAVVATGSALLAKPLADLLLKVVKPVVKKAIGKIQTLLGKKPHRPTLSEMRTNRYREKRGMLGINFGKKAKPLKKVDPPKKK